MTTNGVESVFAVMEAWPDRRLSHASKKHLGRYVDEFAFRLNDGNVKRHTMEWLESFVSGTKGKRLTYKALINEEATEAAKGAGRHCRRGASLSTKTENKKPARKRARRRKPMRPRALDLFCCAGGAAMGLTGLDLTLWASILSGTSDTRSHSFKPTH